MQEDKERNAKIKQLLVKTKKELADSKRAVSLQINDSLKIEVYKLLKLSWYLNY